MTEYQEVTVDEAVAAIERCAFTIPELDEDGEPNYQGGRRIVHCFIGTMGADWDVEQAVAEVHAAKAVGWADTWFGRCLGVFTPDGRSRAFDTVVPHPFQTVDGG